MKKLLFGIMMLFALNVFAQSTHTVDFEPAGVGADWTWIMAENADNPPLEFIANPVSAGINTTPTVAKFTARVTGNPWALCFTDDDGEFTFDAMNATVAIMVYKPVISNIAIKFEGLSPAVEIQVPNTVTNQWEEITFDFSASIGNTYSRLVIIPDFATRTQENIIYFDNIQVPDGNPVGPLPEPTIAAPNPTQNPGDVISMFSDAYPDVPIDTWLTSWSEGALEEVLIDGNPTKKYTSVNFVGVETVGPNLINASSMSHFHMDMWSPDANDFKIKLVDFGADGAYLGGDDSEHELTFTAPATETWISYDIPLTDFTGLASTEHLAQLIMVKAPMGTIYVDNVFYYVDGISNTTTFYPQTGSVNVPVSVSPTLTFSVPVTMANGNAITSADIPSIITLKETDAFGANVPFTGTIDAAKQIITIIPNADLNYNQLYYLQLNNLVIRYQGGDLIPSQSITFTTTQLVVLDLYDNFDDPGSLTWGYWDNQQGGVLDVEAPNPDSSPFGLNPSAISAKYTTEITSDPFTHAFAILGDKLDLTVNNQFEMLVYSENAGTIFAMKLQDNDQIEPWLNEVTVEYTVQNADTWEEVIFDFSASFDRTDLDKLLVMIDPGIAGAGVHYFDEVYGPPFTPPAASPVVVGAYTTDDGTAIEVQFDKDMEPEPGNHGNLNVYVDGLMNGVVSTYRKTEDNTIIVLNLAAPVGPGDVIVLSYLMSGTITSLDNGVLQPFTDYPIQNTLSLRLTLDLYLEGPFDAVEMTTDLYPSDLPLSQPYSGAPWNYAGTESVATIPSADITDWVLIELRDATEASLATEGTAIGRQAAFLLKDGSVVGLDGYEDLISFDVSPQNGLFVYVYHRNHLGILSANEVVSFNGVYSYNFTTSAGQAFGSTQNEIGAGVWGMMAGNGVADTQIDDLDKIDVWEVQAGESGYQQGDFNLDGQVDNMDKDEYWLPNNGTSGSDYILIWSDEFDVDGAPAPEN